MDNPLGQGLEVYGKFRAYLGVLIAVLVCSSLSGSGYMAINSKPIYVNSTTGTAKNVKCSSNICEAVVSVVVSGNTYTPTLLYSPGLTENANVQVYYSNDIPPKFSPTSDKIPQGLGYGLIACGLCIFVIAMIVAYFVSTSRTVAQVYGGVGAVSNFGALIR